VTATQRRILRGHGLIEFMSEHSRTCETCRHWQVFPENNMAGRCLALGAIVWPKAEFDKLLTPATEDENFKLQAEISLTEDKYGHNPVSEVVAVRTNRSFGCILHFFDRPKQIGDPAMRSRTSQ
jgi:hypothetical protein